MVVDRRLRFTPVQALKMLLLLPPIALYLLAKSFLLRLHVQPMQRIRLFVHGADQLCRTSLNDKFDIPTPDVHVESVEKDMNETHRIPVECKDSNLLSHGTHRVVMKFHLNTVFKTDRTFR